MNDAVAFLPNFILVKTRVTHSAAASFAVTRKLTQKNYDVDLNWVGSVLNTKLWISLKGVSDTFIGSGVCNSLNWKNKL